MSRAKPGKLAHEVQRDVEEFVRQHRGDKDEEKQKHLFWDDLLRAYGYSARAEATQFSVSSDTFEETVDIVRKGRMGKGYIDVFAPKLGFLCEHKGRGGNLSKAYDEQALPYWGALDSTARPRYIITSDFARFIRTDTADWSVVEMSLEDLPDNIWFFDEVFRAGDPDDKTPDIGAANIMANLYRTLTDPAAPDGLNDHARAMWITRILFCLYAEDTEIFPETSFSTLVTDVPTRSLRDTLVDLFAVLDTDDKDFAARARFDPDYQVFPYVNGDLFKKADAQPRLDKAQHDALRAACDYDWYGINTTIFGAMFQNAMDEEHRRNLGEHYTTEESINRALDPLIFDELEDQLRRAGNHADLRALHQRVSDLHFLDPAAGCGNFLLVAYIRLRDLERRIYDRHREFALGPEKRWESLQQVYAATGEAPSVKVRVDHFHGIEIGEYPARIAEVAIYLAQHRQDQRLNAELGTSFRNLPLKDRADMHMGEVDGNAATRDWASVVKPSGDLMVVGNPPFKGYSTLSVDQKSERAAVWGKDGGMLDYVTIWFRKATDLIKGTQARAALVSTNSVWQGQSVAPLWGYMRDQGMVIDFAHQTFAWSNEARGMAHVHVTVVGWSDASRRRTIKPVLFTYDDIKGAPKRSDVPLINGYLLPARDVVVTKSRVPHPRLGRMRRGVQPADGGHLILSDAEAREVTDPIALRYLRRFGSGENMIDSTWRHCLWLPDSTDEERETSRVIQERTNAVAEFRNKSTKIATQRDAATPWLMQERNPFPERFIGVGQTQSENRDYVVADVLEDVVPSNKIYVIESDDAAIFGAVSSRIYRAWALLAGGRQKSDISISTDLVHHTFPMPDVDDETWTRLRAAGEKVLAARAEAGGTLEHLYPTSDKVERKKNPWDPTPAALVAAHDEVDRLVDGLFGLTGPVTESDRLAALFDAYAAATLA